MFGFGLAFAFGWLVVKFWLFLLKWDFLLLLSVFLIVIIAGFEAGMFSSGFLVWGIFEPQFLLEGLEMQNTRRGIETTEFMDLSEVGFETVLLEGREGGIDGFVMYFLRDFDNFIGRLLVHERKDFLSEGTSGGLAGLHGSSKIFRIKFVCKNLYERWLTISEWMQTIIKMMTEFKCILK
jgi:hypothetical protein